MLLIVALIACGRPTEAQESGEVIVYFTPDTLGFAAAAEHGFCESLTALLAEYGRDLRCLEGGVSPSSWTSEAHTRMLWPQHQAGELAAELSPACGTVSVLGELDARLGATYVFAADNAVISSQGDPCPDDGKASWHAGTDVAFEMDGDSYDVFVVPEAERAVHHGITTLLEASGGGGDVVGFLNAFEVGGHAPRCYYDPYTEPCEAAWQIAVDAGLVDPDASREAAWLDKSFAQELNNYVGVEMKALEMDYRPIFWGTMSDAIERHRATMFEDRLRRILDGLREQQRLEDLTLVIASDHGENPCVARADGNLNCSHSGLTTEWTGIVPVFVSPAALGDNWLARGFVGDLERPWSTVNLAYGLLDAFGVEQPADWPAMQPVGAATSWTCRDKGGATPSGVHIVGGQSVRCEDGACQGMSWRVPDTILYVPEPIASLPAELEAYGGQPNWFDTTCAD